MELQYSLANPVSDFLDVWFICKEVSVYFIVYTHLKLECLLPFSVVDFVLNLEYNFWLAEPFISKIGFCKLALLRRII